jgi:hypothetical protein
MKRLHILLTNQTSNSPSLRNLICRSCRTGASASGTAAALAQLFNLDIATLAPILLTAEGIQSGNGQWFRADPVHLLAGMHSISLMDSRHFTLTANEAALMISALNAHFTGEVEFFAPDALRWYAHLKQALEVETTPTDQMTGVPIVSGMTTGTDAARLQKLAMEVQMLLHTHPANEARDESNQLPINGVWFWGGGNYRQPKSEFDRVLANDFTATALARAAGIPSQPLPDHFKPAEGRTLVVIDSTTDPDTLDSGWFKPLLDSLKWGQLDQLILETTGPDGNRIELDRWRAWQFWRRPVTTVSG